MNKRMIVVVLIITLLFSIHVRTYAQEIMVIDTQSSYEQPERLLENDIPLFEDDPMSYNVNGTNIEEAFASITPNHVASLPSVPYPEYNIYNGWYGEEAYPDEQDYDEQDYDEDEYDEDEYDDEYYDDEYCDEDWEMGIIDLLLYPFRLLFAILFFL